MSTDLDLGSGTLTAGALVVPGLNLDSSFIPTANPKANERMGPPSAAALSSGVLTQSAEYGLPLFLPADKVLIGLGIDVTATAASSSIRLGVRADDGTGNLNPSTLLLDAGVVDSSSSTGFKEITGLSLALPKGRYWLTATAQGGAPTTRNIVAPGYTLATSNSTPGASLVVAYINSGVTGALSSSWGGVRTGSASGPRVLAQFQ